jgi:hypothetical protein
MKCSTILILFIALLAGCALPPPKPPVELQTKFDYAEHDRYRQAGNGVITGQAFLRQKGGGVVTCAGNPVFLMPATSFFREIIGYMRRGQQVAFNDKVDPAYKSILKQSQCDAQGNYNFSGLPEGTWFITTEVTWMVGYNRQGGGLLREITVVNGQPIQVLLSDNDYVGR